MNPHDALIDSLADDAAAVRPLSTRRGRLLLAAIAAATLLVTTFVLGIREDLAAGSPGPMLGVAIGLFAILAIAAGASAVRMASPQVGAAAAGAPWALAAVLLLPGIVLIEITANPPLATGLALTTGLRCLVVGLAAGLGALAFLTVWLLRGAPADPRRAAWFAGLAAGAIGALAVTLECPEDSFAHVGVWHVAIPLAAGGAARLLLPRFLRW